MPLLRAPSALASLSVTNLGVGPSARRASHVRMSSRRRLSSLSSTPSGRIEGVLFDRHGLASPLASRLFTHDLKAAASRTAAATPAGT